MDGGYEGFVNSVDGSFVQVNRRMTLMIVSACMTPDGACLDVATSPILMQDRKLLMSFVKDMRKALKDMENYDHEKGRSR